MAAPSIQSRIKGSIFGVAVVDALGGPVEFSLRGTFDKVTDFQYNDTFRVPAGTFTDDTSMTLCLAKALVDFNGSFVSQAAIRNYIEWSKRGYLSAVGYCFDIGGCTRQALTEWAKYFNKHNNIDKNDPKGHEGGQPIIDKALKREAFCGNGSLMRVAPIGCVYYRDIELAMQNAVRSSEVTHPYGVNGECCVIYTKLIVRSLNGAGKEDLATEVANTNMAEIKVKDRFSRYQSIQDWKNRDVDDIKSSGYVISTLEAALWSFFTTDSFYDGAVKVVNLGNDADTVGAVYGGLAGAYYGLEGIPAKWIQGLQQRNMVEKIASDLAALDV